MLDGWLVAFGLIILSFYSVYFYHILRGRPEEFEAMLIQAFRLHDMNPSIPQPSPSYIMTMLGVALLLEAGYFALCLLALNIPSYQIFTGVFILFEVVHGVRVFPLLRAMINGQGIEEETIDWRWERASAQLYILHVVITGVLLVLN